MSTSQLLIELAIAAVPTLLAALLASKWYKEKTGLIKNLVDIAATIAVQQVEKSYVERVKARTGEPKLNAAQQEIAFGMAETNVKDVLLDVGKTALKAAGPLVGEAIEQAVANMRKTLPTDTQKLFP